MDSLNTLEDPTGNLKTYIDDLKTYADMPIGGTNSRLGNKYFAGLSGAKCMDVDTKKLVQRSIYINNQSGAYENGNISSEVFTQVNGLIPSINVDINEIDPQRLFQAFGIGDSPDCRLISMETDKSQSGKLQSSHIADIDIREMNACWFPDKKNPITKKTCREGFSNIHDMKLGSGDMPNNVYMKAYLSSLGLLGFYIIIKLLIKHVKLI